MHQNSRFKKEVEENKELAFTNLSYISKFIIFF